MRDWVFVFLGINFLFTNQVACPLVGRAAIAVDGYGMRSILVVDGFIGALAVGLTTRGVMEIKKSRAGRLRPVAVEQRAILIKASAREQNEHYAPKGDSRAASNS